MGTGQYSAYDAIWGLNAILGDVLKVYYRAMDQI